VFTTTIHQTDGTLYSEPKEKANILNGQSQKAFSEKNHSISKDTKKIARAFYTSGFEGGRVVQFMILFIFLLVLLVFLCFFFCIFF
jgi:hypothetical protein